MSDFITGDMKEVLDDFVVECEELLAKLDQNLVDLEKNADNVEMMDDIFRSFHTIKGSAGFLGLEQMVEVVHRAENILNMLRQNELKLTPVINDALLTSADTVKAMLQDIKEERTGKRDISQIIQTLDAIVNEKQASSGKEKKETKEKKEAEKIVSEDMEKSVAAPKQEKIKQNLKEQTIRVDTRRLDDVMNLVGEMVLIRNQIANLQSKMERKYGDDDLMEFLSSTTAHLNLVTTDLQLAVLKTRMQPVKKIFGKFPRMVRDLARENDKEIELIMSGEDTELDKSVIEEIGDPLVHIIRNSVDHGIESADIRRENGKPETAHIKLSAYHEGNNIIIAVEDDGKGIDVKTVADKAVSKELISEKDLESLSEKDILDFIFLPGFSTAQVVSDISGRGVGMDVVKTNIMKLGGIIDIKTESGKGTAMIIKLPITVAIIQSLMVNVGKGTFAIPLTSVLEIIKISKDEIQTIDKREVIRTRDTVLPLIRLKDEFDLHHSNDSSNNGDDEKLYIVVIGLGEKQIGVVVDGLLGQQEVVIKSMGNYLSHTEGIAGATIDGDGKVVLILDIASLFKSIHERGAFGIGSV